MNDASKNRSLTLEPYVFFYGRCEEAMEFYKRAIGGTYEITRVKDYPGGGPPEAGERVMHATFTGNGFSFMAADGREDKAIDPAQGNIALALSASERAEGERLFNALSDGGSVDMPFAEAGWGGRFGIVTDRFGTEWMISSP